MDKTEKYKKLVKESVGDEFEVISDYKGTNKPIKILHKECGNEFTLQARAFLKSPFCRACKEKKSDITGKTFNAWKVIEYDKSRYKWRCQCQCGTIRYIQASTLINNISKSCGCSSWFDSIGNKVGRLTIVGFYDKKNGGTRMSCNCDCGKENVIVSLGNLKSKNPTKSCGCLQDEYRHGQLEDLSGKNFGKWTVIEYLGDQMYSCLCECGTIKPVNSMSLKYGDSKSCGVCTKFQVDETFFDVIDTEKKAYILGFFYADACHYENTFRIKIDLQCDDEEILYKMKEILKFTGNILQYKGEVKKFKNDNGYKEYQAKPYSRLSFSNKHLSEQLKLKGCMANKSKIIVFPSEDIVPKELQVHFIRGYFDGNGTIGYWVANKNTGWKKFNFGICGTTEIINSISQILIDNFNCMPDIRARFKDRNNNNVQLALCGNRQIHNIMKWLYKDSTLFLQRKYEKYQLLQQENKRVDKKNTDNLPSSCFPVREVRDLRSNKLYKTVSSAAKSLGVSSGAISWQCNKAKCPYLIYESNFQDLSSDEQLKLLHKFYKEVV